MSIPVLRIHRGAALLCLVASLSIATSGAVSSAATNSTVVVTKATVGVPQAAPTSLTGKCDNVGSKHFAKTRFLAHGALAFGAFHRYVYRPLKEGGFSAGASKRIRTFLKAGLAGVFMVHEVKLMVTFAEADKTLCKMVPDIAAIQSSMSGLITKLKGGDASATDLETVSQVLTSAKNQAGDLGAGITDKSVSIPGL